MPDRRFLVAAIALTLAGCGSSFPAVVPPVTTPILAAGSTVALLLARTYPPAAVPGALAVPAPTLSQLCTPGYTATVRPPVSWTGPLKRRLLAERGGGRLADFELDHLAPLELGGAPRDLRNLWLEPIADARRKDLQENAWHRSVCEGRASLTRAQAVFLQNKWPVVAAP